MEWYGFMQNASTCSHDVHSFQLIQLKVAWQLFAGAVVFAFAFYGLERAIACGLVQRFRS